MNDDTKELDKVVSIDDKRIKNHLDGLVRDVDVIWLWIYNNERPNSAVGGIPPGGCTHGGIASTNSASE